MLSCFHLSSFRVFPIYACTFCDSSFLCLSFLLQEEMQAGRREGEIGEGEIGEGERVSDRESGGA